MEVEGAAEVDRQRRSAGEVVHRLGEEHLAAQRGPGSSTPASSPARRDQAPAAQITVSVLTVFSPVTDRGDAAVDALDRVDLVAGQELRAELTGREGVAHDDGLRRRVTVLGRVAGGQHVVDLQQRAQLLGLGRRDHPRGDAELVLQRDVAREGLDLGLAREQEQVADLVQVDLPARAAGKSLKSSRLRWAIRMLSGSQNCARTPPAAFEVEPEPSWSRSRSTTGRRPRRGGRRR